MDRRGRGSSGDSPEYDLLREAEDVAAVVEAIGGTVSLLGHSFGGLCSLEAALLTGKIGRLVLYEPPVPLGLPMYAPGFPTRMQPLIETGRLEEALELFLREEVKMPAHELSVYRQLPMWQERIKIVPTVLREILVDQTYRFDAARFAGLHTPTLLLLGSDSAPIFREAIEALEAALPEGRVVVLPGQGHIAMDTAPELFVRDVLQFLRTEKMSRP
jgi:pimeloyl-ACP methyl ester carboxylesterase